MQHKEVVKVNTLVTSTAALCNALSAGWIRPPIVFSAQSVYDGCITIILSNGTIVAQGGVFFQYCQDLQVTSHFLPPVPDLK